MSHCLPFGPSADCGTTTACVVRIVEVIFTRSPVTSAILPPGYARTKTVGMPVPSIEIKLKDVPDAGYYTNKNPQQGEILIRGGSVTNGYFKVCLHPACCDLLPKVVLQRDDLNKESFDEDGWFMTGDIGQWAPDGTLSIIDRKKVRCC